MRMSRQLGTMGGRKYYHTEPYIRSFKNAYFSYHTQPWETDRWGYKIGNSDFNNQCMGYGYEYDENGSTISGSGHAMSIFIPFKFTFKGKSTTFKVEASRCTCPYSTALYNWAISTVKKADDFRLETSPGKTGVLLSGTFKNPTSGTDIRLTMCDITLNGEIKSGTELYFYMWPYEHLQYKDQQHQKKEQKNIHFFDNAIITLGYENNKRNG